MPRVTLEVGLPDPVWVTAAATPEALKAQPVGAVRVKVELALKSVLEVSLNIILPTGVKANAGPFKALSEDIDMAVLGSITAAIK